MVAQTNNADRVVVIGSGPAGATAAHFLCEAGAAPLLLEAGPEHAALGYTARFKGFTFAKRKPPLRQREDFVSASEPGTELYEELAPGGLSNHWSCAVPRFSEEDFADGARAGEAYEWPIGYADVAPWYDRVEPLLHIAADAKSAPRLPTGLAQDRWSLAEEWSAVDRAAMAEGRSVLAMPYANGARTMFTRSGTAFNAYTHLVLPAVRRGAMSVAYDAQVLRLEWSPSEQRVVAVVYRDTRKGSEERVPCSAVVLAAGAVNSAQILLQSSSEAFPSGLGNTHGLVGRYLHDHPLAKLVLELPRPVHIHPASYVTRPPLEGSSPLYAAACMQWCGAPALVRSALDGTPGRSKTIGFSIFGTMVPSSEDFVALGGGPVHGGGPAKVIVRLVHPPEAHRTLEKARDALIDIVTRAGWEPRQVDWKIEAPGNSVHYGGTCRMHASPRFGVVDAHSRIHGVPNVIVADSSVFTTGPEKNPVLTAMALSARASDRLARELRAGGL